MSTPVTLVTFNPATMKHLDTTPSNPLPVTFGTGAGTSTSSSVTGYADDTNLSQFDITTSASVGTWVALFAASASRIGARVQARYAAGNCFLLASATLPASGAMQGETIIPVTPAYFKFDFDPKQAYWVRADTASLVLSVNTW